MFVESILPNQINWSWYHSFQKTMFYLMKSKYALHVFSNIKVTNMERSTFWGTPGIYERVTRFRPGLKVSWSGLTLLYLTLPWSVKVASEDIWVHREVIEQKRDMQAGKWKVVAFLQGKKIPSQWICLACYSLAASLQSWACSRLIARVSVP